MKSLLALSVAIATTGAGTAVSAPVAERLVSDATTSTDDPAPLVVAYGPAPEQLGELWLPKATDRELPVVVLIHGGFWRAEYGLDLMDPLAADLVGHGYAVWNIEYRRVGDSGGGWPGTLLDVDAAVDHLDEIADDYGLDTTAVVAVGHSAGGQLAFWLAGRSALDAASPGADPTVELDLVIGLGAVADLEAAAIDGVGGGAVDQLLGGSPAEVPERYVAATPMIPEGVRAVSVRGSADSIVPARYSVPAGDGTIVVVDIEGDDHFDLIEPSSASWAAVVSALGDG